MLSRVWCGSVEEGVVCVLRRVWYVSVEEGVV
jgi:hypothetical protein